MQKKELQIAHIFWPFVCLLWPQVAKHQIRHHEGANHKDEASQWEKTYRSAVRSNTEHTTLPFPEDVLHFDHKSDTKALCRYIFFPSFSSFLSFPRPTKEVVPRLRKNPASSILLSKKKTMWCSCFRNFSEVPGSSRSSVNAACSFTGLHSISSSVAGRSCRYRDTQVLADGERCENRVRQYTFNGQRRGCIGLSIKLRK